MKPLLPTASCPAGSPARGRWVLLALSALLVVSFTSVLAHVVLAPAFGHTGCLVCQSAHQVLLVGIVTVIVVEFCTLVLGGGHLRAARRCPLSYQGRAPPVLSPF